MSMNKITSFIEKHFLKFTVLQTLSTITLFAFIIAEAQVLSVIVGAVSLTVGFLLLTVAFDPKSQHRF